MAKVACASLHGTHFTQIFSWSELALSKENQGVWKQQDFKTALMKRSSLDRDEAAKGKPLASKEMLLPNSCPVEKLIFIMHSEFIIDK